MLRAERFVVDVAADASTATRRAAQLRYDVVLTDLEPGENGLALG